MSRIRRREPETSRHSSNGISSKAASGTGSASPVPREQPPDELDVEHPADRTDGRSTASHGRRHAEHLRAALRVVDRDAQEERRDRREHASEVVASRAPLGCAVPRSRTRAAMTNSRSGRLSRRLDASAGAPPAAWRGRRRSSRGSAPPLRCRGEAAANGFRLPDVPRKRSTSMAFDRASRSRSSAAAVPSVEPSSTKRSRSRPDSASGRKPRRIESPLLVVTGRSRRAGARPTPPQYGRLPGCRPAWA